MIRRCVTSVFVLALVIKPGIEMLLNSATANDGSRMSNDEKRPRRRVPWIGEHTRPACWSLRPATTNFSLCLAIRQKFVLSRQQHQNRDGRAPQKIELYG